MVTLICLNKVKHGVYNYLRLFFISLLMTPIGNQITYQVMLHLPNYQINVTNKDYLKNHRFMLAILN
jgi:hypothetical protein